MNAIVSARPVAARIDGSRQVTAAPEALRLPAQPLGVGAFTLGGPQHGGTRLLGPRGEGCGVFVSEQMAEATAAHLNRS